MNWKNWPYWLKGALILLVTGIILNYVEFFVLDNGTCLNLSALGNSEDYGASLPLWCHFLSPGAYLPIVPLRIPTLLIGWAFYGTILGWLYGKIKTRKQIIN